MKDTEFGGGLGFDDARVRHGFVRKVLGIIAAQLLLTVAIVIPFILVEEVKIFALTPANMWIVWVCVALTIGLSLAIGCCEAVRRRFPLNIIFLFLFTIVEGVLLGFICATRYPMHVLMAFGITFALCLVLIIFATQVKFDFTGIAPFLIVGFIIIMVMGIVAIFWRNRIFMIVLSSMGVLIFSIWLIIDIQMILGGNHKYQFDPEDYIMAAMSIYVDIITLFLYILNLLGLTLDD